jgi:putative hydrolase of the HAD superfamily
MAKQLKGILFDFDDTLIDWSEAGINWRELEASHLAKVHDYINKEIQPFDVDIKTLTARYMERTKEAWERGRSTLRAPIMPNILMATIVELGVPEDKLDLTALIQAYDWKVVPGTTVFPDVPPMLEELMANNIKIGIVTNASQPMSMRDTELVSHDLMQYFLDYRLSAADAGYLKPHPHIFEYALNLMGTSPEETVFIGDNPIADVAGAQSAGMRAILRVKATTQKMISGLIVPDAAINSMVELPRILDDWFPEWRKNGN